MFLTLKISYIIFPKKNSYII